MTATIVELSVTIQLGSSLSSRVRLTKCCIAQLYARHSQLVFKLKPLLFRLDSARTSEFVTQPFLSLQPFVISSVSGLMTSPDLLPMHNVPIRLMRCRPKTLGQRWTSAYLLAFPGSGDGYPPDVAVR